jgi:hypothetical protein
MIVLTAIPMQSLVLGLIEGLVVAGVDPRWAERGSWSCGVIITIDETTTLRLALAVGIDYTGRDL